MPDIKETLIALFKSYKCEFENCDKCPHPKIPGACSDYVWNGLADHLIANGVTVRNNDQIPEVICDRIIQDPNNGEWLHQFRFKLGDRDWAVEKKLPAELVAACVTVDECIHDCANCYKTKLVTPRWIPVTERLPDNKKCVLMYSPDGGVAEGCYEESRKRWVQWRWSVFDVPNVTHWMPLPEPPKSEL